MFNPLKIFKKTKLYDRIVQATPNKNCKNCMGKGYVTQVVGKDQRIKSPCGCIKFVEVKDDTTKPV